MVNLEKQKDSWENWVNGKSQHGTKTWLDNWRVDSWTPVGPQWFLLPPCLFSSFRNKECHAPPTGHYLAAPWGWAPHVAVLKSLPAERVTIHPVLSPVNELPGLPPHTWKDWPQNRASQEVPCEWSIQESRSLATGPEETIISVGNVMWLWLNCFSFLPVSESMVWPQMCGQHPSSGLLCRQPGTGLLTNDLQPASVHWLFSALLALHSPCEIFTISNPLLLFGMLAKGLSLDQLCTSYKQGNKYPFPASLHWQSQYYQLLQTTFLSCRRLPQILSTAKLSAQLEEINAETFSRPQICLYGS